MKAYKNLSNEELLKLKEELEKEYDKIKSKNLKLNIARGKPGIEQINLSREMLDIVNSESSLLSEDGTDCGNYGCDVGIKEARKLMADIMNIASIDNVIIFGNSSLNIMFEIISRGMTHGILGSTPWSKLNKIKFLCPVPGYDRHFRITEYFGFELISIPLLQDGPDMDLVEKLVAEDEWVKGIWCVPKYANPSGITYSDETVRRFAKLKPKAKDFRIFWDDAYCVHHLYEDRQDTILEILDECKKYGNEDLVYKFASTSKITIPGNGMSAVAASDNNIKEIHEFLSTQTVGHDKINQLRHVRFLKNYDNVVEHMKKQANIIRPKFDYIINQFNEELKGLEIANWSKPNGGYFILFNSLNGCAKKIVNKCKEAGLTLTSAGATHPYGIDPNDSDIRIAPTYATLEELENAMEIFILSVKIVSLEKIVE